MVGSGHIKSDFRSTIHKKLKPLTSIFCDDIDRDTGYGGATMHHHNQRNFIAIVRLQRCNNDGIFVSGNRFR